jgi:hypothetical protein
VKRLSFGPLLWALVGALLLMGLGAVIVSTAFDEAPTASTVGRNAPINAGATDASDIRSNNSPALVRNPATAGNIVVVNRIDTPALRCAVHVSFDGGAQWTDIDFPRAEDEGPPKCFSPDAAFASDGTLYVSFLTLEGTGNTPDSGWVMKSTDGGRTFSEPVRALGRELTFQLRLAVDPSDPRRVHLVWLQGDEVGFLKFAQPGNPILHTRSEDGGMTWGAPTRVSSPSRGRAITPVPAFGPGGELYVLYLDLQDDRLDYEGAHRGEGGPPYQGRFSLVLARSTDGGSTWSESLVTDDVVPIDRFVVFFAPSPSLAVAPDGRLHVAFHDARLGDADVWHWSLAPGSTAWEGPTRVNDTPRRDGTSQYLPQVSVGPDGRVDVVYYDRRADPENVVNHVSLQSSLDGGDTFTESVRLTSRPFSSEIGFGSKADLPTLGSRLALASTDDRALAVWTDTRAGTVASNKQDLARAVVAVSEPARLSPTARDVLRYGGVALMVAALAVLVAGLLARRSGPAAGSRVREA